MGVHEIHNLIVHPICLIAASADRPRRAVLEMVSHQLAAHPAQRFLNRRYLRQDVGAVPVLTSGTLVVDDQLLVDGFGYGVFVRTGRG